MNYQVIDYSREVWCVKCNKFMHCISTHEKFKFGARGNARIIGVGELWECPSCKIQIGKSIRGKRDITYDLERGIIR